MAAHKELRESPETRIPYGQAAKFNIKVTRQKLEEEIQIRQEMEQIKSSVSQVTAMMETWLNDVEN